jgi:uncharacterized membrane protein YdjX (TVP38/TMEM64 family)
MKKSEITKYLTLLSPLALIILLYIWVPQNIAQLEKLFTNTGILGPVLLILWRILGMIIPPIPGGIVSLALIPVIGWFASFVYASIGILIGCSIAFFLARKYREPLVKKFVTLQMIHQWEGRMSEKTEFWTFVGIRFATGPVMDFMSYIAGLSNISFRKFFIASLISLAPDAVYYYLGDRLYSHNPYLGAVSFLLFVVLIYVGEKTKFFGKFKTDKIGRIHNSGRKRNVSK